MVYATGVAFQQSFNQTPNAIALWHSYDGGHSWPDTPTEAGNGMLVNHNTAYFYDKPAMATSTNINFLGRVYVSFVKNFNGNCANNILSIARSRNGYTFDPSIDVADIATGCFTGPQVVVDNT